MSPETDDAFRQRILQVIDPDMRADAMIATGYGLDGLGSLNGLRRKGLPEGSFEDPVVEAFRRVERDMARPAIVPMAHGERPTEPGWYAIRRPAGDEDLIEVHDNRSCPGRFYVSYSGVDMWQEMEEFLEMGFTFIAHIYPDRIEGKAP